MSNHKAKEKKNDQPHATPTIKKSSHKVKEKAVIDEDEKEPGFIYVMKDKIAGDYKIAFSTDPQKVLELVQKPHTDIRLLITFKVKEKGNSEYSAHDYCLRTLKPRLKKCNRGRDWFENPDHVGDKQIVLGVREGIRKYLVMEDDDEKPKNSK